MNSGPKVSILIPTYRYARFLPEALDSALGQEFGDFEVVISDDASGDGSEEILRRYAARDPRIRFRVQERNLGMVANWNWCLAQARGAYVKYLFGDDRFESPAALGRMVGMLEGEPRAVLAASARAILDEDSRRTEVWNEWEAPGFTEGGRVIGLCLRRDRNLIGEPSAVLFRREAGARGFDSIWRQVVDQEMWFHLLTQGGMVYDPEPLCAFRRHAAQQTVANQRDFIGSTESLILADRYLSYLEHYVGPCGGAEMRRFLFKRIYYSRKEGCARPERAAAEAALLGRLSRPGYFACWLGHRLSKPFVNLARSLRRRNSRA